MGNINDIGWFTLRTNPCSWSGSWWVQMYIWWAGRRFFNYLVSLSWQRPSLLIFCSWSNTDHHVLSARKNTIENLWLMWRTFYTVQEMTSRETQKFLLGWMIYLLVELTFIWLAQLFKINYWRVSDWKARGWLIYCLFSVIFRIIQEKKYFLW